MDPNPESATPTQNVVVDEQVLPDQPTSEPALQPLSKKAQKRAAKAAYLAEQKKERRVAEKEKKKEKKRILAQKRAAGQLDEEEEARLKKKRRTGDGPKRLFKAKVVVDLGFDDKMTENEVKSLTSQLAYTYSANRKAEQPFEHLLFTSLDGRTQARMDGMSDAAYKRWHNAEFWSESYEQLWKQSDTVDIATAGVHSLSSESDVAEVSESARVGQYSADGEAAREANDAITEDSEQNPRSDSRRQHPPSSAPKDSIIYLTADSPDELTELKEGETYIIGGIVDHNRYKNLCLDKAVASDIRTARLPIGTYLASLKTRKVLTVNQTFEILLKWVETRDWEQALESVIPKRKFNTECRNRGGKTASEAKSDDGRENEAKEVVINAADLEDAEQTEQLDSTAGTESLQAA